MTTTKEQFLGTWKLLSFECVSQKGTKAFPYGVDAQGYISYNAEGMMSATLMQLDRPKNNLSRQERAMYKKNLLGLDDLTLIDSKTSTYIKNQALACAGYTAYSGSYSIDGDRVIHHVKTSLYPDWVNTDLVRKFSFFEDQLLLTAELDGLSDNLLWQRVGNS